MREGLPRLPPPQLCPPRRCIPFPLICQVPVPTSTIQKHPSPQVKDPKAIRGSSSDAACLPWLTVPPNILRKLEQAQVSAWAQSCVGPASCRPTQVPQNLMHHQRFFLQSPQPASCTTQPPQDQGTLLEGGPWTLET